MIIIRDHTRSLKVPMSKTYKLSISFLDLSSKYKTTNEKDSDWYYYDILLDRTYQRNDKLTISLDDRCILNVTIEELMKESSEYGEYKDMRINLPLQQRDEAYMILKDGIKINYLQLAIIKHN